MSAPNSRLCLGGNHYLVPRGTACIKTVNLYFSLRCLREEAGSSLLRVFPRIAGGCYPPRALRGSKLKTRRNQLPVPGDSDFPWGKTEGNDIRNGEENSSLPLRVRHAGGMRIASTEPAGENGALIVCHRHTGPLFSCKRGPLGKTSHRDISPIHPRKCALRKEYSPIADGRPRGSAPLDSPRFFEKIE